MRMTHLPVCSIGLLGADDRHFHMCSLVDLKGCGQVLQNTHIQDFHMLLYIENATGEISLDHYKIALEGPKIVIIPPQAVCRLQIADSSRGRVVCFSDEFFSISHHESIRRRLTAFQFGFYPFVRLDQQQQERWDLLLDLLDVEYSQHGMQSQKAVHAYLNILMIELDRMLRPLVPKSVNRFRQEKIELFEGLIDEYYAVERLPSTYAEKLHITTNHLNKLCKEETGYTAGEMIRRRIMVEAQRLLHHTGLSVSEIAGRLGFESLSYFVTFFKKYEGRSPEQYRHQMGAEER